VAAVVATAVNSKAVAVVTTMARRCCLMGRVFLVDNAGMIQLVNV